MTTVFEHIAAARAQGDLSPLVAAIPYAAFLGLSCAVVDDDLITTMRYDPRLVGNPALPALHGGTLGALLESAAAFKLLWAAESAVLPKTITLTIEYLRPARPVDTRARATITRHGRRVATVRVEAYQDDPGNPVATANVHFLVKREA
ncbi:MAG: PaaI family thioesterase [Kofleriaceae bacterium]|nr:PaaI family thioesterase [Kofleriaceae bacterium]MCL4223296.1 PaaI family thioesterase [Myxococcales bacterium]